MPRAPAQARDHFEGCLRLAAESWLEPDANRLRPSSRSAKPADCFGHGQLMPTAAIVRHGRSAGSAWYKSRRQKNPGSGNALPENGGFSAREYAYAGPRRHRGPRSLFEARLRRHLRRNPPQSTTRERPNAKNYRLCAPQPGGADLEANIAKFDRRPFVPTGACSPASSSAPQISLWRHWRRRVHWGGGGGGLSRLRARGARQRRS